VPKELATVCQQFLNFFPEYIERATGNEITLDVSKTKNGLKLITYETPDFNVDDLNQKFKQYMQSLSTSPSNSNEIAYNNDPKSELLELRLKLEKQHFTSQLEILRFEKQYLQGLVSKFVEMPEIWANNQSPVYIFSGSQKNKDIEEFLQQLKAHVSGNVEAESLYSDLYEEAKNQNIDLDRIDKIWNQLCEKIPKTVTLIGSISKLFGGGF
jgi:hypothetical protein